MKPFLWRAKRGHSSSGGHNTPFHCGLALKFHRWWEERWTLDPPSNTLRQTVGEVKREMLIWNVVTEEKAVGGKSREVTYFLFSNVIKQKCVWCQGCRWNLQISQHHRRHEPDLFLNQIPNPNIRFRGLSKTIACMQHNLQQRTTVSHHWTIFVQNKQIRLTEIKKKQKRSDQKND